MNPDPSIPSSRNPADPRDEPEFFSIEVVAELAGINTLTVLHYQQQGFIRPAPAPAPDSSPAKTGEDVVFDAECLRQLRRIEHLRKTCGMNDAGLRLVLSLLEEVEQLRLEHRRRRS